MKVRMTVTVDLDPQVWASEYGIETGEVREDVKSKLRTDLHGLLVDGLSIATEVTVN